MIFGIAPNRICWNILNWATWLRALLPACKLPANNSKSISRIIPATLTNYLMTLPLWMANKNKIMFKKLFFFFALLVTGYTAFAQDFPPKPNTLVTDYTNSLSEGDKQQLENKLVAFNDTSSTQIAIVLIKSVGDYDINEYTTQL